MKGYRLSIIRHGRTDANDKGVYIGRTDYPLSERGSAELINKMDEFVYPNVAKVYVSPLQRCVDTAELIYPETPRMELPNLMEMDFGDFEGKSADELIYKEEFKEWLKGGLDAAPPKGESVRDVQLRIYKALCEMIADMMEHDLTHCAVVTHGGIIATMLAGFGVPKIDAKELQCENGEGFDIYITAAMWQRSQAFEIMGMTPYAK